MEIIQCQICEKETYAGQAKCPHCDAEPLTPIGGFEEVADEPGLPPGYITCAHCGFLSKQKPTCEYCGANPATGVFKEWVRKRPAEVAGPYAFEVIDAPMRAVGRTSKVKGLTGLVEKTKKGVFGAAPETEMEPVTKSRDVWKPTGYSDREIDNVEFAWRIANRLNGIVAEGGEVVSIKMTTKGVYDWDASGKRVGFDMVTTGGYGYGYSHTDAAVIIYRRGENASRDKNDPTDPA